MRAGAENAPFTLWERYMTGEERILIVDDDEDVILLLQLLLESRGWRCVTAGSGAQALHQFERQNIGLIITDLRMALGDGITVANEVRRTSDVPIIVMTGFSRD